MDMKDEKVKVIARGKHEATLAYLAKPPQASGLPRWWLRLKKMGFQPNIFADAW